MTASKLIALALLLVAGVEIRAAESKPSAANLLPPAPAREFRGTWVASVGNIDWPSKPGLPTAQQKGELLAILDRAAQLRLNAVILQVRPGCDALYDSPLEPWSEYLTGQMGRPPAPFYDPLAFAVEEAHRRGLELHAWFNPFRARYQKTVSDVAPAHLSRTRPHLVRQYGKQLWLDPAEEEVQRHSLAVVLDVVKRYDVDGVHIDDYFYPYREREAGKLLDFPDEPAWRRYQAGGGKLGRSDWRRENVNRFVQEVHRSIKARKPWVKFGISPFGIWRPGHPPQVKGLDAHEELYADARKWLANGWLDYCAPQLYWSIAAPAQSYPVLLRWWTEQNAKGRHLWPGNNSAKVLSGWQAQEITDQIRLTRQQPGAGGNIHWNVSSLMQSQALAGSLQRDAYAEPALVPASPWLDSAPPAKPRLTVKSSGKSAQTTLSWANAGQEPAWLWVVQTRLKAGEWRTEILPAAGTSRIYNGAGQTPEAVAVSAVDRCGNIGPSALARPGATP